MKTVLLIDEEREPMKYYVRALEETFEVVQKFGPDDALEYLADPNNRADVIVLDIMMPAGREYAHRREAEDGLRTGILLYPDIVRLRGALPTIVLTNSTRGKREFLPGIPAFEKIEMPPSDLVAKVAEILCR